MGKPASLDIVAAVAMILLGTLYQRDGRKDGNDVEVSRQSSQADGVQEWDVIQEERNAESGMRLSI